MKKSTKGIIAGSLAVGFAGGLMMIKKCVGKKEKLSDREKVEFSYLGKQGVADVLNSMSDKEIHDLANSLEVVEDFNYKIISQREKLLEIAVNTTLGLDYQEFISVMLEMYDDVDEVLSQPFCKLIDEYFEITGENIEADGEETAADTRKNLQALDEILKKGDTEGASNLLKAMVEPNGDFDLENYMNKPEDK